MGERDVRDSGKVVGLVPAAGRAKRIAPLPCSKEIFPIGFRRDAQGDVRPEVASHHLLAKFARGGADRAVIILREGKWDIPAYFGDGGMVGLDLAYVVIPGSMGPPDTLDRAHAFVASDTVVFGFPDILFGPDDVFARLLAKQRGSDADIVLGLYAATDPAHMDMVAIDGDGRVLSIDLKPSRTTLRYAWLCAVWTPAFTAFMHRFVQEERAKTAVEHEAYRQIDPQGDLPMGAVIKAACEAGLKAYTVLFPDEAYVDIGVPGHLVDVMRRAELPS